MEEELLDDILPSRQQQKYAKQSYYFLLTVLVAWAISSLFIGLTGFSPAYWAPMRILAALISLLLLILAALGLQKAIQSKRNNEPKSKEQSIGYIGNITIGIIFLLINIGSLNDLLIFIS